MSVLNVFRSLLPAGCALVLGTTSAFGQLVMVESGFKTEELPPGVGAKEIECSPGGIWGPYVYVADSSAGKIERIDFNDNVSVFATGCNFPRGLAFGPGPGNDFGDFLFVGERFGNRISKLDVLGNKSTFDLINDPGGLAFDPTGNCGDELFVAGAFSGPIVTISSSATQTFFAATTSNYIKFGPGGAWGTELYTTVYGPNAGISKVACNGAVSSFVTGFTTPEGFDWASPGGIWDGDLFVTDVFTGEVWRVKPNGTRSLFATLPNAADVAFCNDNLYVVGNHGECWRIYECPPGCMPKVNSRFCTPEINSTGTPSASAGTGFDVTGTLLLSNKQGGMVYSVNGPANIPMFGGHLCIQPPLKRMPSMSTQGDPPPVDNCTGTLTYDFNTRIATDPALFAGVTVNCQMWYRDQGFPPPDNLGLTGGLEFTIQP